MGVHRLEIRGIEVLFPFRPYPSQINYMDKVIQCLNESLEDRQTNGRDHCRRNALLESPTGTGKTMCLLCASYAWLLHFQKKYAGVCSCPKIIFASRTHSQLAQAIREVKASPYSPEICILGSREQMCIHPHVSKMYGTMQNRECITRVSSHACEHYENYQLMKREGTAWNVFDSHNKEQGGFVPDIEDLVLEGTKQNFCPFFYSREVMQSKAEIVFMPYNYLIDARVRKQVGIDVSDAILIFDEAHNLEKWCSDAASFDFQTICIAQSVAELERILRDMRSRALTSITPQSKKEQDAEVCLQSDLEKLKENLLDLDIFIDDLKDVNITKEGDYLLEILAEANIKQSTYDEFQSRMKSAIYYLEANEFGKKLQCRPTGLRNLNEIMAKVFDIGVTEEEFKNYFRIQIHVENNSWGRKMAHDSLSVLNEEYQSRERPEKNLNQAKTLSLWCFNPGLSMQSLSTHKPQCFILTSGTLSPMDSFAYELGLNFPIRLENPHVIKPDQMCIMTASIGPSNVKLNSSHINRDNAAYYIEIGNFLCNMARIVPDGLLVFFPSYYVLNTCTNLWQQPRAQGGSIFDSIGRFKKIFAEPSDGSQLQTVMSSYEEAIKNAESTQGAIFFAVCRGRVSEGLDFSNRNGRCVIIVGMPFPPVKDPKVVLKRQYLDAAADKHKKEMAEKGTKETIYTGNMWYGQESSRAVNQAIGRVIRNKFDYGAVILCDERYALRQNREQLSRWLQKHVIVSKNFAEIVSTLTKFFKRSLTEFGVNGEILKEKFMKQMELLKDEEEDVELLPPQPKVSRPLVNLHATINNPNFKSVDEEPARQVQQVAEPVKISSNVPVEKYRYGSPAAKKPSITRTLQTTNLSHQVGSDQSEEATPVVLNRTIPNLLVQDTTPANQQPITPPKAIPKQSAPPITGVTPSPNGTEKKQVQKRSNAGDYIKSVKQLLTELEYKEFKEILQNFQKLFSKDKSNSQVHFGGVISRILQIFTGPKAKLLDGLREFIPNNMRSKYDSMIQEAQTPPPTTSSPPSTSSSQQPSNKRKREDHYDLLTGTRTNKKAHLMESVKPSNEPITIDDDEDDDIPLTLDLTSTVPNIPQRPMSTVSTPSVVPTQPPASSSTPMTIDDQGGIKCKVCFEFKNEVANSRCGHVLCQDCWDQCLKVKLECPICRERVRPKTLTKIFL